MSHQRRILYVQGFHPSTKAKDLAYEFERFGRLVRCDVPARRDGQRASYAFIEFKDDRDAAGAYHDMHGRSFEGHRLSVQWAKNPPSSVWRFDNRTAAAPRRGSPPRELERDRDRDREHRSSRDDYDRERDRERDRDRDPDRDSRRRSHSPTARERGDRDRSGTYERREDRDRDRERNRDRERRRSLEADRRSSRRSLSPAVRTPPRENGRERDNERPITPPYDR